MRIEVRGKNIELTNALREYVEKRLSKLERFIDDLKEAQVTLSVEGDTHRVEVTIPLNGVILRGEEKTDDMYSSVDLVVDKLEKQIDKYKTRIYRRYRGAGLKKVLLVALSMALVLGLTSVASAAGWGLGLGGPRGELNIDNWTPLSQRLNLTEDQSQKLKELNQTTYEATKELRQKLADAMFELRQMELDTNPDRSAVEAKMKDINELRSELRELMQKERDQMDQILTDEQKQLMKNWRGNKKGPGKGFGHGRGFGPRCNRDSSGQNSTSATENSTRS